MKLYILIAVLLESMIFSSLLKGQGIEVSPDTLEFYVSDTTVLSVLKPSPNKPLLELDTDYSNIIIRSRNYRNIHNPVADIKKKGDPPSTISQSIDTLLVDDGTLTYWGANGYPTWREAVQLPVPQDVTLIGLIYYPGNIYASNPPLSWGVWDDDDAGAPGTQLLADTLYSITYWNWYYFDVTPIPLDSGYVYVGWSDDVMADYNDTSNMYWNGLDSQDNGYNWWYDGSSWTLDVGLYTGDFMVRAVVQIGASLDDIDTMWVKNTGADTLVVDSITSTVSWIVSITPDSFKVTAGDSQGVEVQVDASGLSNGIHYDSLYIYSNDSIIPIYIEPVKFTVNITSIEETSPRGVFSDGTILYPVSPNPFRAYANVRFFIPEISKVSLRVYNISGRLITTLVEGRLNRGEYNLLWDGKDRSEERVPSGFYFLQLEVNKRKFSRRVVVF